MKVRERNRGWKEGEADLGERKGYLVRGKWMQGKGKEGEGVENGRGNGTGGRGSFYKFDVPPFAMRKRPYPYRTVPCAPFTSSVQDEISDSVFLLVSPRHNTASRENFVPSSLFLLSRVLLFFFCPIHLFFLVTFWMLNYYLIIIIIIYASVVGVKMFRERKFVLLLLYHSYLFLRHHKLFFSPSSP